MDIQEFIEQNKITIKSEQADSNPNMDSDYPMNHYKVLLRSRFEGKRRQLTTYFSMGLGLKGYPSPDNVLDSLAQESASVENARNFENWAAELGYDPDSRKAERTYQICLRQAKRLDNFLGSNNYNTLLWEVERL